MENPTTSGVRGKPKALVLFSGGKDSSATAVELVKLGYEVTLLSCMIGQSELTGARGDSAPDIRMLEMLKAFPESIYPQRIFTNIAYLVRKLGIEKTNKEHVIYPLVFALAVSSVAVRYCLKNKIAVVGMGYSGYQSLKDNYIEQRPDFVELGKGFFQKYGITLLTPVAQKSEAEVKDILERNNISSNSLEVKTIFSGIPFDKEKALEFWQSSLPICDNYIANTKEL